MRREYSETTIAMRERHANETVCSNLPKARVIKGWHLDEDGNLSRQVGS
jgi:hypothetical protein